MYMLRNYTIYHRYPVSQEYNEMVDFILRKWKSRKGIWNILRWFQKLER